MTPEVEIALLRKLLKQTTLAYEEQINELAKSRRELRDSEKRLQDILNNIDAYVYLKDPDGCYRYVNQKVCELWGKTLTEVVGRDDSAFFDAASTERIRTNDEQVLKQGLTLRVEEKNHAVTRALTRTYLSTKLPLYDPQGQINALLGVSTDITDRVEAEERLKLAALVYQSSSEAIVITDRHYCIEAVNPAFESMSGFSAEQALSRHPLRFISKRHDKAFRRHLLDQLASQGHWRGEIWGRHCAGQEVPTWMSVNTVFDDSGHAEKHLFLFSDITERKRSDELIWRQANYDALTDLPNRRHFTQMLAQEIAQADSESQNFSLLFLDLDRFKEVNDTLGHQSGDKLLQAAASRILSHVREQDLVARLGGDEFVILMPQLADTAHVQSVTQKLIEVFSKPFELDGKLVYCTVSVGITRYPADARNAGDLLRAADQAMYSSKRSGRCQASVFMPGMQADVEQRVAIANDLRSAIARNEFVLEYQPILSLSDGRVHKAEALLRWQHPERGRIMPDQFISIAEDIGLIADLGDWVCRQATQQLAKWRAELAPHLQMGINRSPDEIQNSGSSHNLLLSQLQLLRLPGDSLVVEVTEGTLLHLTERGSEQLLCFRDAGIQVAIDDFGVGYSSLSYLQRLDIDYLKIDRSFVSRLTEDHTTEVLIEAMIAMAHRLGLMVVAEGVETIEHHQMLQQLECDFVQGYLYARPLSPADFELRLEQDAEQTLSIM